MIRKVTHIAYPLLILLVIYACANIGMPQGGPKDKEPPVIVKSEPAFDAVNFDGDKIRITFNEFVVAEELSDKFIVSPPTEKKPLFRSKGKTFIVDLNEKLKPNTTYSLDFKDGIADNNENNKYRNLRMAFSTGPVLDSLRIVGFVRDAFNLEPMKNVMILLYTSKEDTMVYKQRPDFIAKTDAQGFFAVTNLPAKSFQLFAVSDIDNNLKYTEGVDSISFLSSFVKPTAEFQPERDTVVTGPDTMVVLGKTRFYPDPLNLSHFFEKGFELSLESYTRTKHNYFDLAFKGSTADTFSIEPVNVKPAGEWMTLEKSKNSDSIRVWITDSMVYKRDTLSLRLSYMQQDSLGVFYTKDDTIRFFMSDPEEKTDRQKRKERKKIEKVESSVKLGSNLSSSFDVYRKMILESPEPIRNFNTGMVKLYHKPDTTYEEVTYKIWPDSTNRRRYIIDYPWEYGETYKVVVDSGAVRTIYDLNSSTYKAEFRIKEEDHYGTIKYKIKNVDGPMVIQLLLDNAKEDLVKERRITGDSEVIFENLEPQKYILKAIFDKNNNGKWDSGSMKEKIGPEEVCYYLNVIKVRSNWDATNDWILPEQNNFVKKIVDEELEAEKLKKKNTKKAPQKSGLF